MSRVIINLIRLYQYGVSPLIGPCCRFSPTCSEYASQALAKHGLARGGWLSLKRILRCNPWNHGGHDPVP